MGALASVSLAQNTIERLEMPHLAGSASSGLIKAVAGPKGTTYSLIEGFTAANVQVLGVVKKNGSNQSLLGKWETGFVNPSAEHWLDLTVDKDGNAYVMYDTPDNLSDVNVTKVAPSGPVWTSTIAAQWRDADWNLHPMVDEGSSIAYSQANNCVFVWGQQAQGAPQPSGKLPVITKITTAGVQVYSRPISVGALTSRGQLAVDGNGDPVAGFGAMIQTDPDVPPFYSDLLVAKFLPGTGDFAWATFYDPNTDPDATVFADCSFATMTFDSSNDPVIVGGQTFVNDKGGQPYVTTGELVLKLTPDGSGIFATVRQEIDAFARTGNIFPNGVFNDPQGGFYVVGGANTYADPSYRQYTDHFDGSGKGDYAKADYGFYATGGFDGYGNLYLAGSTSTITNSGMKTRGVLRKFETAFDLDTSSQYQRTEYDLKDPVKAAATSSNLVAAVYNVFPVTKGNPVFASNEVFPSGSGFKSIGAFLVVHENPEVIGFELTESGVLAGKKAEVTITLDRPAPAGGFQVKMDSSNDKAVASRFFRIPEGQKKTSFQFPVNDTSTSQTTTLRIGPNYLLSTSLTVLANPTGVQTITLDKSTVFGGNSVVATITLTGKAAPNSKILLASTNSSIRPPKQIVLSGGETSATVTIPTDPVNRLSNGFVSATLNSTARAHLTLTAVEISTLTVDHTVLGGGLLNGTITLNRVAPKGGTQVSVVTDSAAAPSTVVTVPQDVKSVNFSIPTLAVPQDADVVFTASTTTLSATASTTVLAPKILSAKFDSDTILKDQKVVLTIRLDGVAPQGGLVISLSSSNPSALSVPPTVTAAGGSKVAKITVVGGSVDTATTVVVTATLNGRSTNATATVSN